MAGKVFRSSVQLTREQGRAIIDGAFAQARRVGTEPLTAVVLDGGGHMVATERENGCAPLRFPVAQGKAFAALGIGVASGVVGARNAERPAFLASVSTASGGHFIPVAGGVLILSADECVIGAVGVSGASSTEDESAAIAGIEAAGLTHGLEPL
ncbi:GlcG/HbpS family heme-binding protein [Billgrantia montanilacus]|uniref:Heme-binding protein n=1 Tax=Billgrantia montanilacus TaxID=2282305 RepID=A0A368U636_9GAMM|nr:heme-binding protein [Halomonas montanilacus]RCV91562.1 heme-binding protein [Halomonas montanilacus]